MNPIMFTIGNYEMRYYTFFILIATIVALYLIQREAKRFNIKGDFMFNMCFWGIIVGLISARLYYVIFKWSYFSANPGEIIQIWNGGIAIHGGILGGVLIAYLYCKKYKARMIRFLDFIAVGLLIAQAIGRWGNFFNSEAYGGVTKVETLRTFLVPNFVIEGMKIDGIYRLPTFYFESLACLVLFIVLLIIRRAKYTKVGTVTALYLMGYGVIRFLIEISRTDALELGLFKIAQITSIIMFIIGLVIIMINTRKSKFEDLYNDKNNVDKIIF